MIDPRIRFEPAVTQQVADEQRRARAVLDAVGLDVGEGTDAVLAIALPGGLADQPGIRDGAVLLRVGNAPVRRLADARRALAAVDGSASLQMTFLTGAGRDRSSVAIFPAPAVGWHSTRLRTDSISPVGVRRTSDGVLHLRIVRFDTGRVRDVVQAALAASPIPRRIVIDLRHNGGGSFIEALGTATLFLAAGTSLGALVPTRDGLSDLVSREERPLLQVPLIIVLDRYTASAAEVFAAVLRGTGRATLAGERSSGKCLVEQRFSLAASGPALVMPVAVFVPPGTATCSERGLIPDTQLSPEVFTDTRRLLAALSPQPAPRR
ncbi:hypothetical protein G3576_30230 [Roseomonas stagni]|uniref:Tail specific protease domain-containing protein n=2 Tax=Falsiroseomonas algicola TaxID=2716930 RepID=A0A6M1LV28_9PROT|nr:hypothetical protein [Falsiroseomonas algicola]